MSSKKDEFEFKVFSEKQLKVLVWWRAASPYAGYDGIIADGAIRSGKTVSMSLSFMLWAMESFNGANFAVCGKTIGSLRRNVISPLKKMLPVIHCKCIDKHTENMLTVTCGETTNYFYLFGGKDESSQDLIQGITLAGALFDETALMTESFVNQATARCSIDGAKWWFNCNPQGPFHWFKTGWIDRAEERNLLYLHFLMTDNPTLSQKILARYRGMYKGVFARRFVDGEWAVGDRVIYSMFSEAENVSGDLNFKYDREFISVDYGTFNPCVFLHFYAAGKGDNILHYVDREYYHDGRGKNCGGTGSVQKDDGQYSADMLTFAGGRRDIPIIIDPSASSLITRLRHDGFTNVLPAKNAVVKGISAVAAEFAQGRLVISPVCRYTLSELPSYVWDTKYAEKCGEDRPLKENDHCCDALRYGVYFDVLYNAEERPSLSGRGARF